MNTELSSSFDVLMDHCIMSLNERFSPLQFVKQKQRFGLIEHSRDSLPKNGTTAKSYAELRVNVNNCNQFSQTLRLLKKLTFVVVIRMRQSCVMTLMIFEQSTIHFSFLFPKLHHSPTTDLVDGCLERNYSSTAGYWALFWLECMATFKRKRDTCAYVFGLRLVDLRQLTGWNMGG